MASHLQQLTAALGVLRTYVSKNTTPVARGEKKAREVATLFASTRREVTQTKTAAAGHLTGSQNASKITELLAKAETSMEQASNFAWESEKKAKEARNALTMAQEELKKMISRAQAV